MTDVLMPRLSDSMEEGTILTWLVDDGAPVTAGAELAEIETDKATMTYEAEADGVLSVVAPAGTTVAVGDVIARVGEDGSGDGVDAPGDSEPAAADGAPDADAGHKTDPERRSDAPAAVESDSTASAGHKTDPERRFDAQPAAVASPGTGAGHETQSTVAFDAPPGANGAATGTEAGDVAATPMARRIAAAHGVALASLTGSGPRGRIVRADVERAAGVDAPAAARAGGAPARPSPAPPAASPARASDGATAADERVELSRLQATIARRMAEAKATVPHFQVQTEAEMSAAVALREQLRAGAQARELPVPSLNDLIVKASALALRRFPRANGSYGDGTFVLHAHVNVGIAVAADDALVVPVLHDADAMSVGEIAARTRELAGAVRDGSVTPPQLSSGTFTVSNLGMYGMTAIAPVVNPPQAAILGVGAIRETLARGEDGELVDHRLMTLTLSCDHRILYGADAAQFLSAIRDLLQAPAGLLL